MIKEKILQFAIAKAKKSKLIQSIFEKPIDLKALTVKGTFTDSFGNKHTLYNGLRSKIKPNWESYFQTQTKKAEVTAALAQSIVQNSQREVERIEPLINVFAGGIENKTIAEIGCHAGGVTHSFAQKGAKRVIGTDYIEYKVSSSTANETTEMSQEVDEYLQALRNEVAQNFTKAQNVTFRNDDICNSGLPESEFDLICSWDVLEHIHEPELAFHNIFKILKAGGISIHEYNPFFGLNGGHSPCTLDFPWAHIALNEKDFERYCDEIQPDKKEKALSFYNHGMNRMTIKDLKTFVSNAGLELVAFLPYTKEQHVGLVSAQTLALVQKHYPSATIEDLISPRIVIVLKKASY